MSDETRMTNDELPNGWCWSNAEEIRSPDRYSLSIGPFGSNLKVSDYRDQGVPLVFVREIRAKDFGGAKTKFVTPKKAQELKAHAVSGGDLLITKMGDPPGDVAIYPKDAPDAIITADCIKLNVDPKRAHTAFIAYAVDSPQTKSRLEEITAGVAQQKISLQRFREFPLPLAPLAEQKRITDKLEAVLGRVDACRARLARVPALLKRFRQAVLDSATSGRLTAEWRMANGVDDEWDYSPLGDAVENHDGQRVPISAEKRKSRRGKIPYYGAAGIIDSIDGFTHNGKFLMIGEDGANLLTRSKPNAFIATGKIWVNNHAHVLSCKHGAPEEFLAHFINSIPLDPYVSGSAQPKLNQMNLNRIIVPQPLIPEQQEIVRRVEALFAMADRIEARLATAQKTVDRLTPATLAKAFRGELVPQDPNDEPASVLLERLKSGELESPAKKTRQKRTTKA